MTIEDHEGRKITYDANNETEYRNYSTFHIKTADAYISTIDHKEVNLFQYEKIEYQRKPFCKGKLENLSRQQGIEEIEIEFFYYLKLYLIGLFESFM